MAEEMVNSTSRTATAPISVINALPTSKPEGEMDALLLGRTRELSITSDSDRNWKAIFIALLVIAVILAMIGFAIYLLTPENEGSRLKGRRMFLSDVNGNSLRWRPFNGSWINDHHLLYRDTSGGLSILDVKTFTVQVLMTNIPFRQMNAEHFLVSPDVKFVLLKTDLSLSGSRNYVYDIKNKNVFPLSPQEENDQPPLLQNVLWAPNNHINQSSTLPSSRNGSQAIAFVYENDVYYKPKVQSDLICRLTTTGKEDEIYNGIPEWLYKNTPELKSDTLAFSTDGSYLSFLSFNVSEVSNYKFIWHGHKVLYPHVKSIRYPKEQTINPNVTVYVIDLSVLKFVNMIQVKLPTNTNGYVGGMTWLTTTDLSVTITNREQTSASTVLCRAPTFNCTRIHTENIVDNGWVLPADKTIFAKSHSFFHYRYKQNVSNTNNFTIPLHQYSEVGNDGLEFSKRQVEIGEFMLKRLPVRDGEHGYFRQIVFISTSDKKTVPLTLGRFEVTEILGWDESNEIIYFMATPKLLPGQRHLYKISLTINAADNSNQLYVLPTLPVCMTCDNSASTFRVIFNLSGSNMGRNDAIPNNCMYNKIYFSKDYSYYIQECLGPDSPSVYLVEASSMNKIKVIHSGSLLRSRLLQLAIPQIRTISVAIKDGFHAQVRLFLPPGMREEEELVFPLIIHMDGSPGSQLVSEKYQIDYNWYLCSQKSMIVAQIDARGSGYQGELLRSQVKDKLGTVEIEDQLGVITYLRDNLTFVDPSRICAYGWGYGGYAAAMTLAEDSKKILQCSLAINPIVSFAHYNSFFTERYMPGSTKYPRARQASDLSLKAVNIDSRNFFLIHGTADTIVPEQHSVILVRALVEQGVGFRQQVYADESHNLSGVLYHLFKTIEWFFEESFGPIENPEWDPIAIFSSKDQKL